MFAELTHQAALLPLVLLLLLWRDAPRAWWLVAAAFGVSWIGDSLTHFLGGSWATSYVWLPPQVGLVLIALSRRLAEAAVLILGLAFVAAASAVATYPGPEVIVTVAGSMAIVAHGGPIRAPLRIYFGAGSVCYLMMVNHLASGFMPWWFAYQSCRWLAFLVFGAFVIRERGGIYGLADGSTDGPRGVAFR